MKVKDVASSATKFAARAAAAGPDYEKGVKSAGPEWAARTGESGENWAAGVQDAVSRQAFTRGVQAAGPEKYVRNAGTVGAQRFPAGVRAAEGDWSKGFSPFQQAMAAMTLPPRRPKGDPANYERSRAVGMRLREIKVGA